MLQWETTTSDAFRPSGHRPEYKSELHTEILHQAIVDLSFPKHKRGAIDWIVDPLGFGPTGVITCCNACGYDPTILRERILKVANTRKRRNPGSKPRARIDCPFPGCTLQMPVGRAYCPACTNLLKVRQKRGDNDLFAPKNARVRCTWPGCSKLVKITKRQFCQSHLSLYIHRGKRFPNRPELWTLTHDELMTALGKKQFIQYQGQTKTVTEWGKVLGIHRGTIYQRLRSDWPVERALSA